MKTTTSEPKPRCNGRVTGLNGWNSYPCPRPGKFMEKGKPWCGIHKPSKEEARRAERDARWDAERAQAEAREAIEDAGDKVLTAALKWFDKTLAALWLIPPELKPLYNACKKRRALEKAYLTEGKKP